MNDDMYARTYDIIDASVYMLMIVLNISSVK